MAEHEATLVSVTETHGQEKASMESEFASQQSTLKADHGKKIHEFGVMKDGEREQTRSELQTRIDELLA